MEIIRINGAPNECIEQVKLNLPRIRNIAEFEVYKDDEDIPEMYKKVPDVCVFGGERSDIQKTYSLILRDPESEQEVWVEGANCGNNGSGPSATKEILQLCGVKFDFGLILESDKLRLRDLKPAHDLNIVVCEAKDSQREKRVKVSMKFETAHQKYCARDALSVLGDISPLRDLALREEKTEDYYFRVPYSTNGESYLASTNNTLLLYESFIRLSDEALCEIISEIGNIHRAKVSIRVYER